MPFAALNCRGRCFEEAFLMIAPLAGVKGPMIRYIKAIDTARSNGKKTHPTKYSP